ncbi:MAG TPA: alpha/beta fold hydrolase, partial [Xanthobacteraceae bacterium]|nr:alpha/beta fold hydrolase [Xanthobacteraceae bacterium]
MGTRLLRIRSDEGGMLGMLERRPEAGVARQRPVLLLHGATFGAALLDLPRPGYSLMAALAEDGRAVYALDIRGYGNSHDFGAMTQPAGQRPPFASAEQVAGDIEAAADFIMKRESAAALDLVGFSWGSITAARFAADHPEQVGSLILYAPLYAEMNSAWLDRIADP